MKLPSVIAILVVIAVALAAAFFKTSNEAGDAYSTPENSAPVSQPAPNNGAGGFKM